MPSKTENQSATGSFRELVHKIRQDLDVSSGQPMLSQEGIALESLFVCLARTLRDAGQLQGKPLTDNILHAAWMRLNMGDTLAAHHLSLVYIELMVQLDDDD